MKKRIIIIAAITALVLTIMLLSSCSEASGGGLNGAPQPPSDVSVEYESGSAGNYGDQKLIKTARVSAETKDFEKMSEELRALMKETGAILYSSNVNDGLSYRADGKATAYASYTVKVPTEKLDDFIDSLKKIMNVTRTTLSTQNVSDEYYDLEASVKTLENKYAGLSDMLKNTDKTLDFNTWLKISNELTAVEKELARLRAQFDEISKQVNYATVEISVVEIDELTGEEEKTFREEVADAFKGSFEAFTDIMKVLVIIAIYLLPFFISTVIFSGIVLLIVLLVLRSVRKKKKSKVG